MKFTPTIIPDIVIIEPDIFEDGRGYFMETWQIAKFSTAGIEANFVQDNQSRSQKGILRGLHYQIHQPQGKLVRVLTGEVYDVAVDLRQKSATYGKWVGVRLSGDNKKMLWVPPGFAHGFYVMSESAVFFYKCTELYEPKHERTICWNDPTLNIDWPFRKDEPPILSPKDANGLTFDKAEHYK